MRTGSRTVAAVAAVAAIAAAALALVALWPTADDPFARASALVADADGFDTGIEAGETLARAGELLLDAARRCRDSEGASVRCQATSSASAVAQVFAVEVLRCSAPGRFEAMTRIADYLLRVRELPAAAAGVPQPPSPPDC